jgi:DNA-binding FrmR family transcriptional regulator
MEHDLNTPCCCQKHTARSDEERKRLINRLRRIEGQVRGLQSMLEKDAYCTDILTQCAAVKAALNAFDRDLLARHIRTCVVRDLKNGDESVIDELADTIQRMMK